MYYNILASAFPQSYPYYILAILIFKQVNMFVGDRMLEVEEMLKS